MGSLFALAMAIYFAQSRQLIFQTILYSLFTLQDFGNKMLIHFIGQTSSTAETNIAAVHLWS